MSPRAKKGTGSKARGDPPVGKHAPFREPDPDQKIGPGNPPVEYRWPERYCPNPAGRPRKKIVEMEIPNSVTPMQQKIIGHANRIVGEINGVPVTGLESLLLRLEATADEKPAIAKALLDLYGEAHKDNEKATILALQAVFAYKERWGPIFERAEAAGRNAPPVYPHPRDIIIRSDGTIKIDGPTTAEEAAYLEAAIRYRDVLFFVAEEEMDGIPEYLSASEGRKRYDGHRRKFYRFHRMIPRRLYEPFPPFRTAPRELPKDEGELE